MSWTPATSIRPRAAHLSRMPILSKHRESTDLFRCYCEGFDLAGKDPSPRYVRLLTCRSTPLSLFFSPFANRLRADRGDSRTLFCKRKCVHSAQFWRNVSPLDATLLGPLLCVANKALADHLSSLHSTLTRNIGGGGSSLLLYFLTYLPPLILSPQALSAAN